MTHSDHQLLIVEHWPSSCRSKATLYGMGGCQQFTANPPVGLSGSLYVLESQLEFSNIV